ncbi:MAG: TfoX/Sxy family protein, partial [Steroidobacteraceae bacterium]
LYNGSLFFGLIDDDVLYLKVDDSNRADYVSRGMPSFQPFKDKLEFSMSYFQAPPDVLEDAEQLAIWALRSVAVARGAAHAEWLRPHDHGRRPHRA